MLAVGTIARQNVDILNGDIKLVSAGIGKGNAIMGTVAHGYRNQPFITANTMILMHHEITRRQRGKFRHEGIGGFTALLPAYQPVAQHVLFA